MDENALQILIAAYQNPHKTFEKKNSPVFGYLSEHVPVELIYAADIIPVRIQGGSSADLAPGHLQGFSCSYARSAIHQAINGDYDYLDGLLSSKTCDVNLALFEIWGLNCCLDFTWLVSLPANSDDDAIVYLREELSDLRSALEKYRNIKIPDEKILESLSLYNEIRKSVQQLWSNENKGLISLTAGELIRALKGCQVLPPTRSLNLLRGLLEIGEKEKRRQKKGPRVIILGNTYSDVSLIDMIERCGAEVVIDDTISIGRHFSPNVESCDDPLDCLARYCAGKVTGPYRLRYEERWEHTLKLIREWNIEGCINVIQKYCDTSLFELPLLAESMKKIEIPCLTLEVDDTSLALNQIETRLQAFVEMIGGI